MDDDDEQLPETSSCDNSDNDDESEELEINLLPSSSAIKDGNILKAITFAELGLSKWLCDQLRHLAINTPTPVQVRIIF
ncbi:unnamed protein product [Brugia pahangi]|uniref:RNA helicase n=1 Tax=Brugia pahangi TaxID=6280 RepID=A0A0N4T0B2_BRUPA|nr:unnamed protein product [Brugia pahangi]